MKLTKRIIDKARYNGTANERQVLWDTDPHGLGVRIYPSGRKAFVLSYRAPGSRTKRLMTLEDYGTYTLEQARTRAKREIRRIADDKIDPLVERRAVVPVATFGELCDRWLEEWAKPRRKRWRGEERRITKHLKRYKGWELSRFTRTEVRQLHAKIGTEAPYEANRVLALIRGICAKGIEWQLVPPGWENPGADVPPFEEEERERYLTEREVSRVFRALDREEPEVQAIIRLLLLTGLRKGEALSLRWDRMDLDAEYPATQVPGRSRKGGKWLTMPLSAEAVKIIRDLPRRLHSPWLFPSPVKDGEHLDDYKNQWNRIRRAARVRDVTIHDLRRTMGTLTHQAGEPLEAIQKGLGHSTPRTTRIYARIAQKQARHALDTMGGILTAIDSTRKRARAGRQ